MSRDLILQEIRRAKRMATSLPAIDPSRFGLGAQVHDAFVRNVAAAGGRSIPVERVDAIPDQIRRLFPDAEQAISFVEGVALDGSDFKQLSSAEKLDNLEVAVIKGQIGVAENGAVWITDKNVGHRAVLFIASHVVIVLNQQDLVETMHEACRRMAGFDAGYGVFVCGPSKTADIEQSLVMGAQGPLTLTIFLVDQHSDA